MQAYPPVIADGDGRDLDGVNPGGLGVSQPPRFWDTGVLG